MNTGAVLSKEAIVEAYKSGEIAITPFSERQVQPSSYDVKLGEFYYKRGKTGEFFCPWNPEHTSEYWEPNFSEAEVVDEKTAEQYGVPVGKKVILIPAGQTALCHTVEFIGGISGITTMMKTRSSLGRCDVTACRCAGWGDIGYTNRWTMEITNNSDSTLVLICGERIAQIIFFRTTPSKDKYDGSYDSIRRVDWEPSMMLPKLKMD